MLGLLLEPQSTCFGSHLFPVGLQAFPDELLDVTLPTLVFFFTYHRPLHQHCRPVGSSCLAGSAVWALSTCSPGHTHPSGFLPYPISSLRLPRAGPSVGVHSSSCLCFCPWAPRVCLVDTSCRQEPSSSAHRLLLSAVCQLLPSLL